MRDLKDNIPTSMGDIDRLIERGAPPRVLFQGLSEVADASRGQTGAVSEAVQKGLKKKAEEIHIELKEKVAE